jgi:DUF4097 and DUF4098 domain-containing protein YvlB
MSVDNVYLSIVNDHLAVEYLKSVIRKRSELERPLTIYRYSEMTVKSCAVKAGVAEDWLDLTRDERKQAWELIVDYVYGDELAGLTTNTTNNETKETKMSVTTKTIHTVNGNDVEGMSANVLIDCIKDVEQEIKELKAIDIQSNYVLKKVEELQATLVVVVGHLDAK